MISAARDDDDEAKHIEELILFEANEVASSTTKETNNPLRSLSYETLHEIVRYVSLDDCLCNLRFKLKLEDATENSLVVSNPQQPCRTSKCRQLPLRLVQNSGSKQRSHF